MTKRELKSKKHMSLTKPKPRFKQKETGYNIRHFTSQIRAEYDFEVMDDFLIITDKGTGLVCLTRFMSEALYELYYHHSIDVDKYKVLALDEHGWFDAVLVKPIDKSHLTEVYYFQYVFKPVREKFLPRAIKVYNERYSKHWETGDKNSR